MTGLVQAGKLKRGCGFCGGGALLVALGAASMVACQSRAVEKRLAGWIVESYREQVEGEQIAFESGWLQVDRITLVDSADPDLVICRVEGHGSKKWLLFERGFRFAFLVHFDPDVTWRATGVVIDVTGKSSWPEPVQLESPILELVGLDRPLEALATEIARVAFDAQLGEGLRIEAPYLFGEPKVTLRPLSVAGVERALTAPK